MNKPETRQGILMVRGRGTGFLSLPDFAEDVVIDRERLGFALDGDLVEIKLLKKKPNERRQAKVVEVLKSARQDFVGTIKSPEPGLPHCYLLPDNKRIHIKPLLPKAKKDQVGLKAVVKINRWTNPSLEPIAVITEILGQVGEHETEMKAIIHSGGITEGFPVAVESAAKALYQKKDEIFATALAETKKPDGRRDLRNYPTITIDPADAKDFDDAVSVRTLKPGRFEIGIHIADVSTYVSEGDVIDKEAAERGTSVYLVDRVIPMLPEVLSNDLCSLTPEADKLAFSAIFEVDSEAGILNEWFGQTIIHSDKRLTYQEAQTILDNKNGPLLTELETAMFLARKLRQKRYRQGAIAFEQPEVVFKLDESGKPLKVSTKERTETMLMIEDLMLLANQRVATHINKLSGGKNREKAFVYRVHDVPDREKIEELAIFLHALGYELKTDNGMVKATDINQLLEAVSGKPEENLIKTATIRSMAKAVYTTKNIGHFGLAFKYYTHFTSPIRRYPDLMVHRLLLKHITKKTVPRSKLAGYEVLSIQSSEKEMEAVKAERDSIKFKQVEYLADRVGEEFDGIVTGVTEHGIYVEEKESRAEGMVRLSNLKDDYYIHEASQYRVRGERTNKKFSLGQAVRVKLTKADTEARQLDFDLLD